MYEPEVWTLKDMGAVTQEGALTASERQGVGLRQTDLPSGGDAGVPGSFPRCRTPAGQIAVEDPSLGALTTLHVAGNTFVILIPAMTAKK